MFQENCLCTRLLRTCEILFTSIKMKNNLCQLLVYFLYILYCDYTWMYCFRNKRLLKLHSMVSDMSLCFAVCMWLLLWQRQVWQNHFPKLCYFHFPVKWVQTVNISVFLLYLNLRNFTIKAQKREKFILFWPIEPTHRENINKSLCLFLREVKNISYNTVHLRE